MADDSLLLLGSPVVLTKRPDGLLDVATGKKTSSATTSNITAIRGADMPFSNGSGTNIKRIYQIDPALELTNDNAHRFTITDGGVLWKCTAVIAAGGGKLMSVMTERSS